MKKLTCFFIGDRKLPGEKMKQILINLDREVDNLILEGVTDFISGGDLGFDQMAASLIIAKKEMGKDIRLIIAMPCRNQDKTWTLQQNELHRNLLAEADEVVYVLEKYTEGCVKKRNRYMVDRSAYCICALLYPFSGTGRTINYARRQGLQVTNTVQ